MKIKLHKLVLLALIFSFQFYLYSNEADELENKIAKALATDDPAICEIMIDEKQVFAPKLGAKIHSDGTITSPPLEDLSPFLSKEELEENMLIKPFDAE